MTPPPIRWIPGAAATILALALLEISGAFAGAGFSAAALTARAFLLAAILAAARFTRPSRLSRSLWSVPLSAAVVAGGAVAAALLAVRTGGVWAAGASLAALFALTLAAATVPALARRRLSRAARLLLLAAAAGAVPMAAVEIETGFAHEEIFVALQALLLAAVWFLLWTAAAALWRPRPGPSPRDLRVHPLAFGLAVLGLALCGLAATVVFYQRSFSPPDPPPYPGISSRNPFLCGEGRADPETFDGREVFEKLLDRVEAAAQGAPENGMLALARRDAGRAADFRSALLREVAAGRFSRLPETKYWQFEASQRAYYYPRVRAAFPGLFAPEEQRRVSSWFAAINRRALAPGPDDGIYALAFAKTPEGPYENQENGAGLLSLLEAGGLAAPELSERNRRYLDRAPRGWQARFRNNDDSFGYQPVWIQNAFFQSLRTGRAPEEAMRRSFEWLLLQAPPDGDSPDYNLGASPMLPGAAYLGAELLRDPRLVWLSGRSIRSHARRGLGLAAQPGVEAAVDVEGRSPEAGSCLLYADSGLPNRVGPLAPDKIVFRDGWTENAAYLLLNLRFAGWHRYRATNAVVMLRRGEALVDEKRGRPFSWLPAERRIFRDKRIPREYLNGLLVEPAGFSGALSRAAGFGGPWAQDPPHYARVESFRIGSDADRSVTVVSGWQGWSHRRAITFFHGDGPIVVVDEAIGPPGRTAALAWHVQGRPAAAGRFRLGAGSDSELVLLPLDGSSPTADVRAGEGAPLLDVLYRPPGTGGLRLASIFLAGRWLGARTQVRREGSAKLIDISSEGSRISVALP